MSAAPQSPVDQAPCETDEALEAAVADLFRRGREIQVTPELLARRRILLDQITAAGGIGEFAGFDAAQVADRTAEEELTRDR